MGVANSGRGGNSGHGALHQPRNYALRKKREKDLLALWQVVIISESFSRF